MKNDRTFVSFLRDIFQRHDAQQRYNYYLCDVSDQRVCDYIHRNRFSNRGEYEHDTREYSNKLCRDTVLGLFTFLSRPGQLRNSMTRFSPRYKGDSKK